MDYLLNMQIKIKKPMIESCLRPVLLLVFILCSFPTNSVVKAQVDSPYDLIATVNAMRASQGLAAYTVNSGLMSFAQEHADYMASIHTATHTHSDGTVAWEIGIQENIAMGTEGMIDSSFVVYQIWADYTHWHIMADYASGEVGAGVTLGDDGMVYYVLNVRVGEEVSYISPTQSTGSTGSSNTGNLTATPNLIASVVKSTPATDGSIIHTVGYGQSLWSIAIAYDVKIDQIRNLNGIAADSTTIFPGQDLLIQVGNPQTATVTAEETESPTRTTSPTKRLATVTPRVTKTVLPSSSASMSATIPTPDIDSLDNSNSLAMIIIGISFLGLVVVVVYGFLKTNPVKPNNDQ